MEPQIEISPPAQQLALAYPATARGLDRDPLLDALEAHCRRAGLAVTPVGLDPRASDRALTDRFRAVLRLVGSGPQLIVGGFSLGARIAAMAAPGTRARALLCVGYPFHVRGNPKRHPGLDALRDLSLPTWIGQGSRDAHGSWEQIRGYPALAPNVALHWLADANHRLQTRGACDPDALESALQAAIAFLTGLPQDRSHG